MLPLGQEPLGQQLLGASAQLDVKALNFFSATNTARLQREVNNGLAMAHFKSTRYTGLLLVNTVITRFSLVRKDQNCERAEQQKLVEQMAILDTCKAKNLVYGSFHPLQNPPMFSVSYPPSLTGNHFCHLNLTSNFASNIHMFADKKNNVAVLQVETGETIVEAAAREVREECGYIVRTEDLGESDV